MPRAALEDHLRGASNDWRRMTSVPQLFSQTLFEAWDSLYEITPVKCSTSIDLPGGRSIKMRKKFSRKPALYKSTRNTELRYLDKNSAGDILFSALIAHGLKILNEYAHTRKEGIDQDSLVQMLYEYYPACLAELGFSDSMTTDYEDAMNGTRSGTLTHWSHAERQCQNAAESARHFWEPDFTPRIKEKARELGAKGGRAYKAYNLDMHLATAHMKNVSEVARTLGISRNTVYAMRRAYADLEHEEAVADVEQEPTSATVHTERMVADRPRAGTRDSAGPAAEHVGADDAPRGDGSPTSSARTVSMADSPSRILLDGKSRITLNVLSDILQFPLH